MRFALVLLLCLVTGCDVDTPRVHAPKVHAPKVVSCPLCGQSARLERIESCREYYNCPGGHKIEVGGYGFITDCVPTPDVAKDSLPEQSP